MSAKNFYSLLEKTLPARGRVPFEVLDWEPKVNFLIFVHRVEGLKPGLYFFFRNLSHLPYFKENSRPEFSWSKPEGCPDGLPFFSLISGDAREAAKAVSCTQDIASDVSASQTAPSIFGTLRRSTARPIKVLRVAMVSTSATCGRFRSGQ